MLFTQGKTEVSPAEVGYDESRLAVLNRHYQSIIDDGLIQCAMYCITRNGKVFAHGAVGKKSYREDDSAPALPDSIRGIASITKVICATAIMKLVEDGHVLLNTPVAEILPQFNAPPYNQVNLLQLLTHTSGMHADGGVYENKYQTDYWSMIDRAMKMHNKDDGELDWVAAALSVIGSGLRTKPGEEWSYCSFGYVILGEVIRKITGVHAHDYIIENITKPLGMKDTCFDLTPEFVKRLIITNSRSEEYYNKIANGTLQPNEWDKIPSTGGGMSSTAYDLTRFGNMFLQKGKLDGVRIMGRKTVELMTRTHISQVPNYCWGAGGAKRDYAAGFDLRTDQPFLTSRATFSHEGAGAASLYIDPQEDMVAAWFVPYTDKAGWVSKALFNALNIIWSGLT